MEYSETPIVRLSAFRVYFHFQQAPLKEPLFAGIGGKLQRLLVTLSRLLALPQPPVHIRARGVKQMIVFQPISRRQRVNQFQAKQWAVGHARYERLVLIRFDDEPAYGLSFAEAAGLGREVRAAAEMISRLKAPMRQ